MDILAQQVVAAVACDDWNEDELFELVRRAYPFRDLSRDDYESIVDMVSEGIAPERGRFGAYVQRDRVNRRLHARKGARLTAITCGGAIPEIANYKVVTDDENRTVVGTAGRRLRRRSEWRATSFCWATRRGGSSMCAAAKSSCRMPRAPRQPFRSGWAKRRDERSSSPRKSPGCGRTWLLCSLPLGEGAGGGVDASPDPSP